MAFFESEKTSDTPEEECGGCLFCHDRSGSKVPIAESKSAPSIFHHRKTCWSSHTHSCNLFFSVLVDCFCELPMYLVSKCIFPDTFSDIQQATSLDPGY